LKSWKGAGGSASTVDVVEGRMEMRSVAQETKWAISDYRKLRAAAACHPLQWSGRGTHRFPERPYWFFQPVSTICALFRLVMSFTRCLSALHTLEVRRRRADRLACS
jgi:hypothetical protein